MIDLRRSFDDFSDVGIGFEQIESQLNDIPLTHFEGKLFEISTSRQVDEQKIRNPFTFVPLDVIVTSSSENGFITFHLRRFTEDHIVISSSGECRVRVLIGRFKIEPVRVGI